MKTSFDPRHKKRQEALQSLFAESFHHQQNLTKLAKEVFDNKEEIDKVIQSIAPEFPLDKINKVDLAILRIGVYELTISKKEPPKVVVDESIELAKEFGGESSPGFINGALGKLIHA